MASMAAAGVTSGGHFPTIPSESAPTGSTGQESGEGQPIKKTLALWPRAGNDSACNPGEAGSVSSFLNAVPTNPTDNRGNPMAETRPNGLAAALQRAQTVSDRLVAATEAINERLREVQTALVRLRLGVRGVVDLVLPGDEPEWRRYLVFGKINGDWLLFVESGPHANDDFTITPLLNASREIRLASVDVLPLLVQDMVDAAESGVAESEAKARALDEFLATIQQPAVGTVDGLSAHGIGSAVAPAANQPADPLAAIARKRGQTKQVAPGTKGEKW
jgi:hypothetical protein